MNSHLNTYWIETEITSFYFSIFNIMFSYISLLADKVQSTAPIFFSHPNKTTDQESQGKFISHHLEFVREIP